MPGIVSMTGGSPSLRRNRPTVTVTVLVNGLAFSSHVIGLAMVLALCAVLTYGLGVWLRRGWVASLVGLALIALPYAVATVPLLPDALAQWLLRLTPAGAFAVQQTAVEYPQVTAHYAPSAGYFPLPWWAGLALLGAYTAIMLRLAAGRPAGSSQP